MVIMWPNKNGTVTLSQRQAGGRIMPTVVRNPPRNATLSRSGTSVRPHFPTKSLCISDVERYNS